MARPKKLRGPASALGLQRPLVPLLSFARRLLAAAAVCALATYLVCCESSIYPYYIRSRVALDAETCIVLYFDSSGSMTDIKPALDAMVAPGGRLHEALGRLYGDSYDHRVIVVSNDSENTLQMLALEDFPLRPAKCLVFVFQDEISGSADIDPESLAFRADIATLRARIESEFSLYRGVMVHIEDGSGSSLPDYLQKLTTGAPPYDVTGQNLADYASESPPRIRVLNGVPVADAAYYAALVLDCLERMGIRVPYY